MSLFFLEIVKISSARIHFVLLIKAYKQVYCCFLNTKLDMHHIDLLILQKHNVILCLCVYVYCISRTFVF